MRYLIMTFLLFFHCSYSQQKISVDKDSLVYRFKNCEEGKSEAKADFINGNYNCVSYGLMVQVDEKFDEFVATYRKEKYGMVTKSGGCVVTEFTECYSQTMKDLILEKFGKDIFERSREEAKKIYGQINSRQ